MEFESNILIALVILIVFASMVIDIIAEIKK